MEDAHEAAVLRAGPVRLTVHRAIYGTIIVMAALAVYDQPEADATLLELVGVVVAPLLALAAAHAFSEAADRQIARKRPLSAADWRAVLAANAEYLYVAVPPLVVLAAALTDDWSMEDAVAFIMFAGMLSLVFWGWYGAERAGLSTRWRSLYAVAYGAIGGAVLLLELALTH